MERKWQGGIVIAEDGAWYGEGDRLPLSVRVANRDNGAESLKPYAEEVEVTVGGILLAAQRRMDDLGARLDADLSAPVPSPDAALARLEEIANGSGGNHEPMAVDIAQPAESK
jgi:hypothetical protein